MELPRFAVFIFALVLPFSVFAQEEKNKSEFILTGYCTADDMIRIQATSEWYVPGYAGYTPDAAVTEGLKKYSGEQITFTVIMGIWCSDSREHVPRFFKVIDEAGFSRDDVTMIAVDRKKTAEGIDLTYFSFVKIPTIIIYKDETELGRIIETPAESVESDLLNILNSKNR